jgi:hypothetical protein
MKDAQHHAYHVSHPVRVQTGVARLASLLRRRRTPICVDCAALKLGLDLPRVFDVVENLAKTVSLHEEVGRCSICGASQWALSLRA